MGILQYLNTPNTIPDTKLTKYTDFVFFLSLLFLYLQRDRNQIHNCNKSLPTLPVALNTVSIRSKGSTFWQGLKRELMLLRTEFWQLPQVGWLVHHCYIFHATSCKICRDDAQGRLCILQ